jgi:UMF1 family MFS transporter
VGVAASLVFYDSLLPHIAKSDELDRVSTAGFAMGFVGGGLLLLVNLAWILWPATFGLSDTLAAIKLSFVSVAVWWFVFTLPLLRRVPEPAAALELDETGREGTIRAAFVRVLETFRELRTYRQAFLMLVAFLLYNDGIQTIIRMASIYGAEIGIDRNAQIAAFVLVQFVGVPCSFAFGALAGRIGPKRALLLGLVVYVGISLLGYFMRSTWQFFALAILVGTVQGGSQALSRSLFARMIPKHKSSEYFGFFAVFEKFAGIAGPALFALSVTFLGSSRLAVLSVILFFVLGGLVLTRVDVEAGEAYAKAHP